MVGAFFSVSKFGLGLVLEVGGINLSIMKKIGSKKIFGITVATALAFSALTATPAQAITDCPVGWTMDPWASPAACDFFIQGDGNFTVPDGVTSIAVMAIGGGGAGGAGGFVGADMKAGGGGGGAEISQTLLTVTPGDVLTADIAQGGVQASLDQNTGVAGNGGDGATTTLKDASNNVLISAVGGKGGESGTNGGYGGDSGNSNPANIHAGGAGFNGSGASSGGGGGGQWTPGNAGALNVGGSAGTSDYIIGLNGLPDTIQNSLSFQRDATLYPNYYPSTEWISGAGLGGGGGTFQNDGDGCNDNQMGLATISPADPTGGQVGQGSCMSSNGYQATAALSYSAGYPGQGGSGGVGVDTSNNANDSDHGTFGVDGLIWLRVFLDAPPAPTGATYLDADSQTLDGESPMTVTTDADPNGGYWMGLWVDGAYQGPAPVTGSPIVWSWSDFSSFATCESRQFTVRLFDPSVTTASEPASGAEIDGFTFTYAGDSSKCNAVKVKASKTVSGFAGDSPVLTSAIKKAVKTFVTAHSALTKFTCTGYIAGPVQIASNKTLAKARAKAVCGYIKKLKPSATTTLVAAKPGTKYNVANRKVVIAGTN